MTRKLYYEDSYTRNFEAEVVSCEPVKDVYQVVLDQTAFFPEGGGQYADTGWLHNVEVLDVQEKEGIIYHTTASPLTAGRAVTGKIRWEDRFEKMQQHTGEHIVSGLVHERFGYDNVGFHLGNDYCTMDFNGPITRQELKEIEKKANQAVYDNLDVQAACPSREELRTLEYRSKIEIEGQVRIVTVPGYDVCACCAPHVKKTGEIGIVKLINMINYKGGERITMLCGWRALKDYDRKDESTKAISEMLCAKEYGIAPAVSRLKEEVSDLKGKLASMQQKILSYQAAQIEVDAEIVTVFDQFLSGNAPREFMNLLLGRGAKVCAVFSGTDEKGYRYVIGSRTEDVRAVGKKLNEAFHGKGGGKPEMVQGSLCATKEDIQNILS